MLPPVSAEDGLYERGIELVEQKNYEKALKAFELGAKTGELNAMTALGNNVYHWCRCYSERH